MDIQGDNFGLYKGASIKYVRIEGDGGGDPKAYSVREVAWIYYCRFGQNGYKARGGGPKSCT